VEISEKCSKSSEEIATELAIEKEKQSIWAMLETLQASPVSQKG